MVINKPDQENLNLVVLLKEFLYSHDLEITSKEYKAIEQTIETINDFINDNGENNNG